MTGTILIVDDVPLMRALINRFLTNAGYETLEAANGAEAIALLDGRWVGLVVCDFQMPNINGIDFTLLVRIHELYAALPILMLSANTDQGVQDLGRKAGVTEWMGKPFTEAQLVGAVKRLMLPPG